MTNEKNKRNGLFQPRHSVYAVYGLTEWQVLIHAGRTRVRVRFAGGSLSSMGVVPATFRTANPFLKRLIENCPEFLCGRIKRLT